MREFVLNLVLQENNITWRFKKNFRITVSLPTQCG